MRVLVKLDAAKDCSLDMLYHHKLQGFVYSQLRGTEFSSLHDKRGYKPFCFSNVFPARDLKAGDACSFIFSTPIEALAAAFAKHVSQLRSINIGDNSYSVEHVALLRTRLPQQCTLITGTPIIIRTPRERYAEYGITEPDSKYPYVYWKPKHSFNAFIKQLEDNVFKKYNEFASPAERFPLFEQFFFKKTVCNHAVIESREIKLFGSVWQFLFQSLERDGERRRLLEFAVDSGFGELNALGFGFMNVSR